MSATSLQILAGLGFRRILLLGVDASYGDATAETSAVATAGKADSDHFIPDYRAGLSFDTTTPRNQFVEGWALAAAGCEKLNIAIRNASRATSLTCFVRCNLDDGLLWLKAA